MTPARALLALAADLEAAERERDEARRKERDMAEATSSHWSEFEERGRRAEKAERDLATAREALEGVIRRGQMGHGMACAWIADDALRSLGEKA